MKECKKDVRFINKLFKKVINKKKNFEFVKKKHNNYSGNMLLKTFCLVILHIAKKQSYKIHKYALLA